ncbi:MAG: PD40 domain-containing protein [candidate division Zixibacteria bacterium]|nr:PD40 domain-containing protein [candidate division Zixibacteria bacterium]
MKINKAFVISVFVFICIALVLIVRLSLTGFTAKISPNSSKEECLKVACRYLENDEPESAIYPLLLAIQKEEDDFRAHFLLAKVYRQVRIYHLAERECKTSLELNPENREALELLCQIKFEQGKLSWKEKNLQQAILEFTFVVAKSEDQKLIDSIAHLTGGRFKITRLTNDLFCDDAPSFSPDGKRIVYHSDTSYFLEDYGLEKIQVKKSRIFVMDADGKNKTCLFPPEEHETSERFARFSHDGRFVVYEKENSSPHISDTIFNADRDIFIKNLYTGEAKRLTHDDTYDGLPSFSSDDSEIIFVSDRPGARGSIYRLNLKSRETESISLKKSWEETIGLLRRPRGMVLPYCPSFSPDGKFVLLHAGWENRGVFLLDIDSKSWRRLTDRRNDCFFPSFSVDGKKIVFVFGDSDEQDLYIMDVDGSTQIRLTYDGGTKRYPSFSPDGNSIIFAGKRKGEPDNYFEIYLLHLDQTINREKLKERLKELERVSVESLMTLPPISPSGCPSIPKISGSREIPSG